METPPPYGNERVVRILQECILVCLFFFCVVTFNTDDKHPRKAFPA